jgi:uncharacterized membrane protein
MLVHRPAAPGQLITEDWPVEPTWAYPESKVRTEQLIRDERGSMHAVLLRISGVYDDLCHSIPLANQIQRIHERQFTSRVYSGSTAHGQSFMHMDDLVDAIALAVERRATLPPEVAILLGEPDALSYDELQHTFARLLYGVELETLEIPGGLAPLTKAGTWVLGKLPGTSTFIRPWMIDRANDQYELDITRARTLLGWEPKRSLRETIPKMIAALKADSVAWYRENDLEPPPDLRAKASSTPEPARVPADGTSHAGHAAALGPAQRPVVAGATHEAHAEEAITGEAMAHRGAVWPHFANMSLGIWLMTGAAAMGAPGEGLRLSDLASGTLVVLLALLSLSSRPVFKLSAPWASSLVGIWLLFAPLVFWTRAAEYTNDTLVGALVIAFAILAPGMPGMRMLPGPDAPPGWSYNPSSWPQRAPIIALALVGFFLSRHMAAFQLEHITSLRDPVFGSGTERVLKSEVSRAFPIPDAGLGAVAYMIEFLMGFMGDKRRWRTMPWMVTFFGILVVPLGVVSITLMALQPIAVGAWCSPCLVAAAAMLIMISLTLDEVVAMGEFLVLARREGQPLWHTFWNGGTLRNAAEPGAPPVRPDVVSAPATVRGVTPTWNLLRSVVLGLWLMLAPYLLGSRASAAHSDHLLGAIIVTVAMIALADVGRAARFINLALGAWVMISPWLLEGATASAAWNDAIVGALVILLSFRRGRIGERYGAFERFIR